MTRIIPRDTEVETYGLAPTDEERAEGVLAVTVFAPVGKTAVFVLMECLDGTVVTGHSAASANHLSAFDTARHVEAARVKALRTVCYLQDRRRERQEQRARELAGDFT